MKSALRRLLSIALGLILCVNVCAFAEGTVTTVVPSSGSGRRYAYDWCVKNGDAVSEKGNLEQQLYELIEDGVRKLKGIDYSGSGSVHADDYIDFSDLNLPYNEETKAAVKVAFNGVFFDHPEFFYLHQNFIWYHPNGMLKGIVPLYHEFATDADTIAVYQAQLERAIDMVLEQTQGISDPVGRLLVLYEYLAANNVYNLDVALDNFTTNRHWPWSAYGALIKGDTVCKGLAMAYKLLIDRLDDPRLQCIVVSSKAMDHVWNMVAIDGRWYHVDVNKAINSVPTHRGISRHVCFLLSDAAAAKKGYTGWQDTMLWEMPVCTDTRYESGWAFENVTLPIYQQDGLCYIVKKEGYRKYALFSSRLDGSQQTRICAVSLFTREFTQSDGTKYFNLRSGIVWENGYMYYVDEQLSLRRYSLADGESEQLCMVGFKSAASEDGVYHSDKDGIMVYLDRGASQIVAASRTTGQVLARYSMGK